MSSDGDEQGGEEEQVWDDWEDDGPGEEYQCLFCGSRGESIDACFRHMASEHAFDFQQVRKGAGLEFYDCLKMINYIRSEVAAGRPPSAADFAKGAKGLAAMRDDKFLIPVMQDDAVMFGFDEAALGEDDAASAAASSQMTEVEVLRAENAALQARLDALKETMLDDNGSDSDVPDADSLSGSGSGSDSDDSVPDAEDIGKEASDDAARARLVKKKHKKEINEGYFGSYGYFGIHREMISDRARTHAYQQALEQNPGLMKGATVLDVGCGTGILSMFAARGGAAKVVAVDGAARIAEVARAVTTANGFAPTIEVVTGMLEKLPGLPVEEKTVDVIVSEWMGYGLLFECMFDSVVYARDRWLKPGGCVLPDEAVMYVAGAGVGATGLDFWDDVYGFSMKHIRDSIRGESMKDAVVEKVEGRHVVTTAHAFKTIDLCTVTTPELDFTSEYEVVLPEGGAGGETTMVWALVVWFDTNFSARYCKEHPVVLSTSPHSMPTHWHQTVLYLKTPIALSRGGGAGGGGGGGAVGTEGNPAQSIKGLISITRSKRFRGIDIGLQVQAVQAGGGAGPQDNLLFQMD